MAQLVELNSPTFNHTQAFACSRLEFAEWSVQLYPLGQRLMMRRVSGFVSDMYLRFPERRFKRNAKTCMATGTTAFNPAIEA